MRWRRAWSWIVADWRTAVADWLQWKWIIALILIEFWRLKVELDHLQLDREIFGHVKDIQQLIIDFMDAVVPGPRG
jgi:hypothetical protein